MIGNKKVLVNILARAGSTSVKDKNIAIIEGNPVLWYSVSEALKSKYADDICVSTDSQKYADIAIKAGVKVPFLRDKAYATKNSTAADASKWTTLEYEKYSGKKYDYIIDFMNSNPCKLVEDLDACIEILHKNEKADTVVAVNRVWDGHPDRIKQIKDGEIQDWPGNTEILESLRQDLKPPAYIRSGSVYAMKRKVLIDEGNRRGKVSLPYIIPEDRVCNIDEPKDLLTARAMLHLRNQKSINKINSDFKILAISRCDDLKKVKDNLEMLGSVSYKPNTKQDELKEIIHDYDILFVATNLKFDKSVWSLNSKIKIIATPSVGEDHLDLSYLNEKGVKIISLKGQAQFTKKIYSPAELSFCHLINISKKFNLAINSVRSGFWTTEGLMGNELYGKTIGIIGFGSVGGLMAKYCKAFGMKIITFDPYKIISDPEVEQINDLDSLLQRSDVVSLHASKNDHNHHLINKRSFELMKDSCIFINTSRGGLVDEKAMLEALKDSKIMGAGVDVLEGELSNKREDIIDIANLNELNNYKNLFITPHLGGSTFEGRTKRSEFTTQLIVDYLKELKKN